MSSFIPQGNVTVLTATTDIGNVATASANIQSLGSDTVQVDSDFSSNVCIVTISTPATSGTGDQIVLLPGQSKIINSDDPTRVPGPISISITTLKGSATVYVAPGIGL
jgi:hypothetical protein